MKRGETELERDGYCIPLWHGGKKLNLHVMPKNGHVEVSAFIENDPNLPKEKGATTAFI